MASAVTVWKSRCVLISSRMSSCGECHTVRAIARRTCALISIGLIGDLVAFLLVGHRTVSRLGRRKPFVLEDPSILITL